MNLKDLFNFLRFPTLGTVFVTNCKNSRKKQIGALRFLERYNFAARGNICMYLCRSMKKSAKDEIAPHLKVIMQCSSKKNIQKKIANRSRQILFYKKCWVSLKLSGIIDEMLIITF